MTSTTFDVPAGLNGVVVADTAIGDVLGDESRYHYRGLDAAALATTHSFEEVWHLVAVGHLPDAAELAAFTDTARVHRDLPSSVAMVLTGMSQNGATLGGIRSALSIAAGELGLAPLLDLSEADRATQAGAVTAVMPTLAAALHRSAAGLSPVTPDADLGTAGAYLQMVTGERPTADAIRALETYLILTIDHGFNASTFTARVVASTGADLADVVCAALGALSGPLHGGAPSRALDALDAIGDPANAAAFVRAEVEAGRRLMGFGHAVYRDHDPRSDVLRNLAIAIGGELVDRAADVEARIVTELERLKPGRQLPSNVEYYAGVVMASCGLPRTMFTPTFAVSRTVGWCAHAVEQAATGKLIRPSSRYVSAG